MQIRQRQGLLSKEFSELKRKKHAKLKKKEITKEVFLLVNKKLSLTNGYGILFFVTVESNEGISHEKSRTIGFPNF